MFSGQGFRYSNVSFLFSLKNKDNVPPFKAPFYRPNRYLFPTYSSVKPCFRFGDDLFISDNSHDNQQSYSDFGDKYQPPAGYVWGTEQAKSLLAGSFKFTPTQIEVFY